MISVAVVRCCSSNLEYSSYVITGVGKVLFRISGSRIARELVELKSQRPRAKRATRDGESSPKFRHSGNWSTKFIAPTRRSSSAAEEDARGRRGEKHDCTPRKGRKRRKGESGEIRREKETTWPGSKQLRVKRRRYARRSDETEGKWRKKTMKGDVRRENGRSLHFYPLLNLLVAFAIGWLELVGWLWFTIREADTSAGGGGRSTTGVTEVEVRQERYDKVGG